MVVAHSPEFRRSARDSVCARAFGWIGLQISNEHTANVKGFSVCLHLYTACPILHVYVFAFGKCFNSKRHSMCALLT